VGLAAALLRCPRRDSFLFVCFFPSLAGARKVSLFLARTYLADGVLVKAGARVGVVGDALRQLHLGGAGARQEARVVAQALGHGRAVAHGALDVVEHGYSRRAD